MQVVTDADFDRLVLHADGEVVVDFWQGTCGPPCTEAEEMLDGLVPQYPHVTFYKLDTATNPLTTALQHITEWPTVIIYKAGKPHDRLAGPQVTEQNVREALE